MSAESGQFSNVPEHQEPGDAFPHLSVPVVPLPPEATWVPPLPEQHSDLTALPDIQQYPHDRSQESDLPQDTQPLIEPIDDSSLLPHNRAHRLSHISTLKSLTPSISAGGLFDSIDRRRVGLNTEDELINSNYAELAKRSTLHAILMKTLRRCGGELQGFSTDESLLITMEETGEENWPEILFLRIPHNWDDISANAVSDSSVFDTISEPEELWRLNAFGALHFTGVLLDGSVIAERLRPHTARSATKWMRQDISYFLNNVLQEPDPS